MPNGTAHWRPTHETLRPSAGHHAGRDSVTTNTALVKEARRSFAKIAEACVKGQDEAMTTIVLDHLTTCIEHLKNYIATQQAEMARREKLDA